MAKWKWEDVAIVRGWTQFDDFIDIQIVTNDGIDHLLRVLTSDPKDTIHVEQYANDKLVNCEGTGEPGWCESCEETHRGRS